MENAVTFDEIKKLDRDTLALLLWDFSYALSKTSIAYAKCVVADQRVMDARTCWLKQSEQFAAIAENYVNAVRSKKSHRQIMKLGKALEEADEKVRAIEGRLSRARRRRDRLFEAAK
jgi:urease gamma subunit